MLSEDEFVFVSFATTSLNNDLAVSSTLALRFCNTSALTMVEPSSPSSTLSGDSRPRAATAAAADTGSGPLVPSVTVGALFPFFPMVLHSSSFPELAAKFAAAMAAVALLVKGF